MSQRMWKADLQRCEVREVEAEPHPGCDSEGATVYTNTHFETRDGAVRKLMADASAGVCAAGREVARLKRALIAANQQAADDAERYHRVDQYVRYGGGVE